MIMFFFLKKPTTPSYSLSRYKNVTLDGKTGRSIVHPFQKKIWNGKKVSPSCGDRPVPLLSYLTSKDLSLNNTHFCFLILGNTTGPLESTNPENDKIQGL